MARRSPVKVTVDLSGPLFTRDPGLTVKGNIRRMMDGIAQEGQTAVRAQIASLPLPYSTGWTVDHAIGRTTSYAGKHWWLHAVISANTDGMDQRLAIRTKAAAASVERRFHPFRRVGSALKRSRAVLVANLTEGLE